MEEQRPGQGPWQLCYALARLTSDDPASEDVVRLGIRDIPIQTRPQRIREMNGVPVAIVTITFATNHDGSMIGDIYDS